MLTVNISLEVKGNTTVIVIQQLKHIKKWIFFNIGFLDFI